MARPSCTRHPRRRWWFVTEPALAEQRDSPTALARADNRLERAVCRRRSRRSTSDLAPRPSRRYLHGGDAAIADAQPRAERRSSAPHPSTCLGAANGGSRLMRAASRERSRRDRRVTFRTRSSPPPCFARPAPPSAPFLAQKRLRSARRLLDFHSSAGSSRQATWALHPPRHSTVALAIRQRAGHVEACAAVPSPYNSQARERSLASSSAVRSWQHAKARCLVQWCPLQSVLFAVLARNKRMFGTCARSRSATRAVLAPDRSPSNRIVPPSAIDAGDDVRACLAAPFLPISPKEPSLTSKKPA